MKRIFSVTASLVLSLSLANADTISLEPGWNLLGAGTKQIDINTTFQGKNVPLVWGYENIQKKWIATSPDATQSSAIVSSGYSDFEHVPAFMGYWVKSDSAQAQTVTLQYLGTSIADVNETTVPYTDISELANMTVYSDEFEKFVISSSELDISNLLNPEAGGGLISFTIANDVLQFSGEDANLTMINKGSDFYTLEYSELENGEISQDEFRVFTSQNAMLSRISNLPASSTDVWSEATDTANRAGFIFTKLEAEKVGDNLVIKATAQGNISDAINSTPTNTNHSNVIWIGINEEVEYGLMDWGYYIRDNSYSDGDFVIGDDIASQCTHSISDNVITLTMPISVLTNQEYFNISVSSAEDFNNEFSSETEVNDEYIYYGIDLQAQDSFSANTTLLAQSIARGEVLYTVNCASCHGADATATANLSQYSAAEIEAKLSAFKEGTGTNATMINVANGLTSDGIKDLASYIGSI